MLLDEEIEIVNPDLPRGRFRSALFDFDGTLSLIREGWPQVMIPMMTEMGVRRVFCGGSVVKGGGIRRRGVL